MYRKAITDDLTGLVNHNNFVLTIDDLIKEASSDTAFSVVFIDVDNFKRINDTYGHDRGDSILRFVGDVLSRNVDASGTVFRYGGDEFAVIFQGPDEARARGIMESIRTEVAGREDLFSDGSTMSVSSGLYVVRELSMTSEQIFYRADQALYQAKFDGKNRCVTADK